jgi:RNA polymerase sigma-70 factor (ECF subfamily)
VEFTTEQTVKRGRRKTVLRNRKLVARDPEEVALLQAAQNGDDHAFGQLVIKYRNRVASIAYQVVGNYEDASDVAQEVFIKVYRSLQSFDLSKKFYTWIYRLTMNASIDFWRRNRKYKEQDSLETRLETAPHSLSDYSEDLETSLEKAERHQLFLDIADTLNENQRAAFLLCDIQGLNHDEVAEILGCPKVTLRWYLHEGRKKIKNIIRKRYPEYFRQSGKKRRKSA